MGKKKVRKHQKEPNESSHSSEDEDHELLTAAGKSCPHIVKSVSLNGVKKVLKHGITVGQCETCCDKLSKKENDVEENIENDIVWLCLQCGHQGCGRGSNGQHALQHFKTPRSDSHSIVTNTLTWEVWCYECDDEVNGESNKKLSECINYIRRQCSIQKNVENSNTTIEKENGPVLVNGVQQCKIESIGVAKRTSSKTSPVSTTSNESSTELFRVKGLRNLGNTCFFNAIMQNLTRCHWLSFILEEFCAQEVSRGLPGMEIKYNEGEDQSEKIIQLDPLFLLLTECGPLTQSLLDFFREMRSSTVAKGSVVNPGSVLAQICKKAPQFRGTRQQDSHELLRHLIDGVRTEEIRRQKTAILKSFNLKEKVDPKNVPEEMKQKIRAYGRLANHTMVDWLFSGQLISTVLCKECDAASQISEPFLDLSLPVAEEKPLRPVIHKRCSLENNDLDDTILVRNDQTSRYKEKKLKRKAKKDAKRGKYKYTKNFTKDKQLTSTFDNLSEVDEKMQLEGKDSEHSDGADIEDNTESESLSINDTVSMEPNISSPTNEISDEICSRLNGVVLNEGETNSDDFEGQESVEMCHSRMISERNRLRQEWLTKSLVSLSPRYQPASHECSILSCLNQFTAPELLTGNNKFGCENCTKIRNEKLGCKLDEKEKKNLVYSNASKQLLILSPPAVMTLHLKRFQQVGHTLRKVNRHVEFPLVLDLAPFCSSISIGLPNMEKNQSRVLYSLFGIVEHMGRLASGHYTAFVKCRDVDHAPLRFLNTKAACQFDLNKLVDEMVSQAEMKSHSTLQVNGDSCSSSNDIEELMKSKCGKWYYISDSSVSEVPEATVLRSQAYILFYERIL